VKLDDDVADWIVAAAAWWLRHFGPIDGASLVLPIDAHFPRGTPDGLLAAVTGFAGMEGWRFELVDETDLVVDDPMPHVPRPAFPKVVLVPEDGDAEGVPLGGPYPISCSAEVARDPVALVALLARGVSHYLLSAAPEEVPADDEQREAFVEIGAVLLGFGVFVANDAFSVHKFESAGGLHGWSTASRGVLGEDALGFALALFVELAGADAKVTLAHLSANPKAAFRWAHRRLQRERRADVDRLRAVVPVARGAGPYR
jgi:hypothetical protein